ncbi:antibiotic biosynthesis monooxygenase family protein [Pseudoteredinibacter isoporae]|uniref:Heme-degrading monooxygenase HmoA n=1 Tax=Pseudoteredinibacter isoporae TaxID=570281 RepID=A0A7X0JXC3_9GAMM|nr:antibiotic biosynthesis monooxygenase [Pseudoteredinibacter isoporae]MBB6523418.1 heme-degrading monooxygenase HmoA [Pseudoteredinibacter isoporae]NHO88929.1 antibiotic biosynthesis monooxygenase [Pseudoteredinibacter isoporae]NIB24363.1 antibiotic biosynthesis monooxygenase [Pseudoteredinibacter isoporae]
MIAVLFEVIPKTESKDRYFSIAQALKSELYTIEGFISVERFQSLNDSEKFLSLSFWEDEAAVLQWKSHFQHQTAQDQGKKEIFNSFRIRVGEVIRDYDWHTDE